MSSQARITAAEYRRRVGLQPAGADRRPQYVPPSKPDGMNKTEAAYALHLEALRLAGKITGFRFEAITFRLAKRTRYTPDFHVWLPDRALLNGAGQIARTTAAGIAFLPNLTPYQDVAVALATSTLEDPFSKPTTAGFSISPRPGKVVMLNFPVVVFGEITGTVLLRRAGATRKAGGVDLELVDRKGVVVKRARSAYDGFYEIEAIPPGGYTLSVTAQQVTRLRVVATSRDVRLNPSGTVLDGLNFVLDADDAPGRPQG